MRVALAHAKSVMVFAVGITFANAPDPARRLLVQPECASCCSCSSAWRIRLSLWLVARFVANAFWNLRWFGEEGGGEEGGGGVRGPGG